MDVMEAILRRRTIKDFLDKPVLPDVLERVLTAGLWAQNHHLTQPWRFTVLGPQAHHSLAELSAAMQPVDANNPASARSTVDRKLMSKPLIVVVTYHLSADAQQRHEDFAATCCAVQNIQLAAWAEGLGMQWSSNRLTRNPATYALLGIDPANEEMVGFLYFGYPASIPIPRPRKPLSEVMRTLP
jgi:nitroreductase